MLKQVFSKLFPPYFRHSATWRKVREINRNNGKCDFIGVLGFSATWRKLAEMAELAETTTRQIRILLVVISINTT